jgi:hypothetical protein
MAVWSTKKLPKCLLSIPKTLQLHPTQVAERHGASRAIATKTVAVGLDASAAKYEWYISSRGCSGDIRLYQLLYGVWIHLHTFDVCDCELTVQELPCVRTG